MEQTIEIKSLPEQIFSSIKKRILSGELKGGERIPEVGISQDFGVSRTPVREALRRLEEYGLVRIERRRYAEVLKMTPAEVGQITLVRIQIEKLAAGRFIERAADGDLNAVRGIAGECRRLSEDGDAGGFYEKDSQFHLEIARRAGNPFLYDLLVRIDAKVQLSRLVKSLDLRDIADAVEEHEAILSALAVKDAGRAGETITSHIKNNL